MNRYGFLLFIIFFWVFRNTILVRGRTDYDTLDIYGLIQIFSVFLISLILLYCYRSTSRTIYRIKKTPIFWFFLIYLLGFFSMFWSLNLIYSGYRSFECLMLFLGLCVVFYKYTSFVEAEKKFLKYITLFMLLMFIGQIKLWGYNISIDSLHTNTFSFTGMIIFLYTIGELVSKQNNNLERKKYLKKYAIFSLFFIIVGTSSASNIATIIGLVVISIFTNRRDIKIIIGSIFIFSIVLFFLVGDLNSLFEIILPGKSLDNVSQMSGRAHLWEIYLPLMLEKPYLGWGFSALNRASEFYATNLHNSILSILGGMGFFGIILFVLFLISSINFLFKAYFSNFTGSIGSGAALTGLLVNAMSIGVLGEGASPVAISLVLFMAFLFMNVTQQKNLYLENSKGNIL